ncbi:MAG: hypothetical protein HXX11_18350 [Desulfuromonadales bacterium]|nr:hypothetical protein [Desulfuromonadales bacterium]
MTPPKIQTKTPLTTEYLEQKKLVAQNKKLVSSQKQAKTDIPPDDVVTLSSEHPDAQNVETIKKPSQPVTFEEKQALKAEFSVRV